MTDNSYLMQYFLEHSPKEKDQKPKDIQKTEPDEKNSKEQK